MTAAELQTEIKYRRRDPTPVELVLARHEVSAFALDLERQELLERVVVTSRIAQRDRQLERRFKK
jgi:hypothetical protein